MASCRASLLAVLCIIPRAGCLSFNLSFSQPESLADLDRLIYCTGDAYLTLDTLELTRTRNRIDSTGRATYTQPVRLWDAATGEMASFTTSFDFQITLDASNTTVTPGDGGMAFVLSHHVDSGIPPRSSGASLGLLPYATNGTGDTTMVAVEFDTCRNQDLYGDISGNHVAIDVNSLNSAAVTDTTSPTRNLTSGYKMTATVRYENVTKLLAVELTVNGDTSYHVNATVDLRSYLPEHVVVGFSAATGGGGEQHQILSWSFISTLQEEQEARPVPPPLPLPPPPPPPPPPPLHQSPEIVQHPNKRSVGRTQAQIVIISVLAAVLGVFLLACAAVLVWRHKRHIKKPPNDQETSDDSDCELERGVAASGPRRYAYRELAAATNNFADDKKLGRGGFGSVYRGKLAVAGEDRPVAIKMLSSESSEQGRKEFEAEVRIISRLKHRNLVRLLGWCDSRRNGLLLVYELVAKGSLDTHLHSSDDSESFLTWSERYQIILGLGSALRYLHQDWEQCVVHGDIKPSNIMLDESLGARLGDFGLARLGDHGARWQTTRAVMGTAGYIDPEFVNTRHPSTYSDVYGFGILLLEIVSGRCPVILLEGGAHFVLVKWMWGLYGRNTILDAADERLRAAGDEADDRCMERVLVVGLWCAHPDQSERPSIEEAMHVLQSEDARLPTLTPQMYRTVSEFAVTGRAIGAFSVQSSSSETTATTSKVSSESASFPLLRDSK